MKGFKRIITLLFVPAISIAMDVKDVYFTEVNEPVTLKVEGVIEAIQYTKPDLKIEKVDKQTLIVKPLKDKIYKLPVVFSYGKYSVDTVVFVIKKQDREALNLKRVGKIGNKVLYKNLETGDLIYRDE